SLGAPDFSSVSRNVRIVGHVLRFERRDTITLFVEITAQGGGDGALPDVGTRPLHHDSQCGHFSESIFLSCTDAVDQCGERPPSRPLHHKGQKWRSLPPFLMSTNCE